MRTKRACLAMVLMVLTLAWASPAPAGDNPFKLPPPFKSAIISYMFEGNQTGHSTVYYKGEVKAEHKTVATKVLGFGSEDQTIIITEPQRVTTVDLKKGKATYTGNYLTYMAQEYQKLSPAEKKTVKKNAEEMGNNFMAMMGGKPQIRQGTFMGHPVDIVSAMGITSYTWRDKHVVLKQEGGLMGMTMNMTATDIKTGVPVPSDKLKVPAGMTAVFDQQADQQQRDMAKRVMDMLKDPEFGKKQGQAMQDASRQMKQAQDQAQSAQEQAAQEQSRQAPPAGGESATPPAQQEGGSGQSDPVKDGLDAVKKIFKW